MIQIFLIEGETDLDNPQKELEKEIGEIKAMLISLIKKVRLAP